MNLYEEALMRAPSMNPGWCVICGSPYTTPHHPVRRSQGGTDGPTLALCGSGSTGCHGEAERGRIEFRYDFDAERWEYLTLKQAVKYDKALAMDGWRACG